MTIKKGFLTNQAGPFGRKPGPYDRPEMTPYGPKNGGTFSNMRHSGGAIRPRYLSGTDRSLFDGFVANRYEFRGPEFARFDFSQRGPMGGFGGPNGPGPSQSGLE